MKYKANPVIVDAFEILSIGTCPPAHGGLLVQVNDEEKSIAELTPEMLARYTPVVGDFLVIQEDKYRYVNPREVFLRKYSPVEEVIVSGRVLVTHPTRGAGEVVIGRDGSVTGTPEAVQLFNDFCKARPALLAGG